MHLSGKESTAPSAKPDKPADSPGENAPGVDGQPPPAFDPTLPEGFASTERLPGLKLRFDAQRRAELVAIARQALEDHVEGIEEEPVIGFPSVYEGIDHRAYVILREQGRKLGAWWSRRDNLAATVYRAARRCVLRNEIELTRQRLPSIQIHVVVLGKTAPMDRSYEHGVHAIEMVVKRDGKKRRKIYHNAKAIEGNFKPHKLARRLCRKLGAADDCHLDDAVGRFQMPTLHFGTTRFDGGVVSFYRGNVFETPLGQPVQISARRLRESMGLMKRWIVTNLRDDGLFRYLYNPSNGSYTDKNNTIRQLMASRSLAELAQHEPELRALHRANMRYWIREWFKQKGELGYILYDEKSKLGAMAMALRAVVASPFYEEYAEIGKQLYRTILYLRHEDGGFRPWFIPPKYETDADYLLTFYSGEALLALVEYFEKTQDTEVLAVATQSAEHYMRKYVDELQQNYYPAYVPWHTIALNKLYPITQDQRYFKAVFVMNDKLLELLNTSGKPYPDYLGRFFNPATPQYGDPHSSSDGVYVDGLAYAWEMAQRAGDSTRMERYRRAIELGAHNLIHLQYRGANEYFMEKPERVHGAIRVAVDDNRVRIDTVQHAYDGFVKIDQLGILK